MIRSIFQPHLPQGRVRHIIIGERYRDKLCDSLEARNVKVLWLPDNPYLDERLSGHTDLSAVITNSSELTLSGNYCNSEIFDNIEALGYHTVFTENPGMRYPDDARLNFYYDGIRLLYNPKTADSGIISRIHTDTKLTVKQGYTKCSVCAVASNAFISGDKIISEKLLNEGSDVLYIKEPFVRLNGFDYGFIGGATFKLSKDELAFTGVINDTEIRKSIETFLDKHNIEPVYLTTEEVFDIGSAVLLTENTP